MDYSIFNLLVKLGVALPFFNQVTNCVSKSGKKVNLVPPFTNSGLILTTHVSSESLILGLVISFFKGVFGFTPIDAWQKNYTLNCCIVISLSLLYLIFLDTSPASWDPSSKKDEESLV